MKAIALFILFLSSSLFADTWYVFDATKKICKPAFAAGKPVSPDYVINNYNCKIQAWNFSEGWIVLSCNDVSVRGSLLFTTDIELCNTIKEEIISSIKDT